MTVRRYNTWTKEPQAAAAATAGRSADTMRCEVGPSVGHPHSQRGLPRLARGGVGEGNNCGGLWRMQNTKAVPHVAEMQAKADAADRKDPYTTAAAAVCASGVSNQSGR